MLTDNNEYIDSLREKDIETVIPPIGGRVKILHGPNKNNIGILKERNK